MSCCSDVYDDFIVDTKLLMRQVLQGTVWVAHLVTVEFGGAKQGENIVVLMVVDTFSVLVVAGRIIDTH